MPGKERRLLIDIAGSMVYPVGGRNDLIYEYLKAQSEVKQHPPAAYCPRDSASSAQQPDPRRSCF